MIQYRIIDDKKGAFGITVTLKEITHRVSLYSGIKKFFGQPYHVDEEVREIKVFIPTDHSVIRYSAMCYTDGTSVAFDDWKRFCNLYKLWRNKKGE